MSLSYCKYILLDSDNNVITSGVELDYRIDSIAKFRLVIEKRGCCKILHLEVMR
jgi:hypothetical protein